MSKRPQRERKQPERFGIYAPKFEEEESETEAPPRRRQRRQRAEEEEEQEDHTTSAAHDSEDGSDSEGSDGEDQEEEHGGGRGTKGRRGAGGRAPAQRASKPFVPPPPAEPRSRGDMLSLLFACPALIDKLLEPDGLRPVTLVARDASNLASALGARSADMAVLWHQLARRCDPRLAATATPTEALAVVRRAVRADPSRSDRLSTSQAASEYRVGRKELEGLRYSTRYSHSFWASTVKMFSKLDVLSVAHRKWGHMAVLEAERAKARARSAADKEKREDRAEQRKQEITRALTKAGLEGPTSRRHGRVNRKAIKKFIKTGEGDVAAVVASIKQERKEEEGRQKRVKDLRAKLGAEGLADHYYMPPAQAYISGTAGKQNLAEVVAAVKKAKEESQARIVRQEGLRAALTAEGMQAFLPQYGTIFGPVPGMRAFWQSGEGSQESVLEAARQLRQQEQARLERRAQLTAALAAGGVAHFADGLWRINGAERWVLSGEGSLDAVLEAAQTVQAREQAREDRRAHITELLAAEGLQLHIHLYSIRHYIEADEGSEDEVMAAARAAGAKVAERQQRHAAFIAALAAEGLELLPGYGSISAYDSYVDGRGSLEAGVTAMRAANAAHQERQARQQELSSKMEAAGLRLQDWLYRVPGLNRFLSSGEGSADELMEQAQGLNQAAGPALHGYLV